MQSTRLRKDREQRLKTVGGFRYLKPPYVTTAIDRPSLDGYTRAVGTSLGKSQGRAVMGIIGEWMGKKKIQRLVDSFTQYVDEEVEKEFQGVQGLILKRNADHRAKVAVQVYDEAVERSSSVFGNSGIYESLYLRGGESAVHAFIDEIANTVYRPYVLDKFGITFKDWMLAIADKEGVPRSKMLKRFEELEREN